MLDIPVLSVLISAFSVVIALVFALVELRHLRRQRESEFIYKIQSQLVDADYRKAWNLVREKKAATFAECTSDDESHCAYELVCSFYHSLGVLLNAHYINCKMLNKIIGRGSIRCWERCKPYVEEARIRAKDETLFWGIDHLHNEMEKYLKHHSPKNGGQSILGLPNPTSSQ